MIFGAENLLLGSGIIIDEQWDNLTAWDLNAYQVYPGVTASGTAQVSGNRVLPLSYGSGTTFGPVLSIDLEKDAQKFTLTTDASITLSSRFQLGGCTIGVGDSSDVIANSAHILLFNSTSSNDDTRVLVQHFTGGVSTIDDSTTEFAPGTYDINILMTRNGSLFEYSVTGDITLSGSFTWSGVADVLFVQFLRYSGTSFVPPAANSVGPLTFEY